MQMADLRYDLPDARGHFGPYGGVFVAETLIRALDELKERYARYREDPAFVAEFEDELAHYVGRPSPVYHARRLSDMAVLRFEIAFGRFDLALKWIDGSDLEDLDDFCKDFPGDCSGLDKDTFSTDAKAVFTVSTTFPWSDE